MNFRGRYVVHGPPGTGKTTFVSKQVIKVLESYDWNPTSGSPSPAVVCSLTRAAAREVAGRNLPIPDWQIGTLHSMAYRQIGSPEVAESQIEDWNQKHPENAIGESVAGYDLDETTGELMSADADHPGSKRYQDYCRLRAMCADRAVWPYEIQAFASMWEDWKRDNSLVDFADMIDQAADDPNARPPGGAKVIIVDEAQDISKAEHRLLNKYYEHADAIIHAGDMYQCQPPGTMVSVSVGRNNRWRKRGKSYVAIESLDPSVHRLISFSTREAEVRGFASGFGFRKAMRFHRGRMFSISAMGMTTRCTPEHKWTVRIVPSEKRLWHALYLMRKDNWWRVGVCHLFRSQGKGSPGSGVALRTYQENADCIYVLRLFRDRGDALAWEQIVSCKFGIPTTCFADHTSEPRSGHRNHDRITMIMDEVGQRCDPAACIAYFGRDVKFPFWTSLRGQRADPYGNLKMGRRAPFRVCSCNLLPEVMQIPVHLDSKRYIWSDFSFGISWYEGPVYSLEVEKHGHYIADGLITHNSIYRWRGADDSVFRDPSTDAHHTTILQQSFRVPKVVKERAVAWLSGHLSNYVDIAYNPRPVEGNLDFSAATYRNPESVVDQAESAFSGDGTLMIAASCNYMLRTIIDRLRKRSIPFSNPWRPRTSLWNPLGGRTRSSTCMKVISMYMSVVEGRPMAFRDVEGGFNLVGSKDVLKHGVKAWLKTMKMQAPNDACSPADVDMMFTEKSVKELMSVRSHEAKLDRERAFGSWMSEHLRKSGGSPGYVCGVVSRHGLDAIRVKPRVFVGTIHSFKGAQADSVVLFPDLSNAGWIAYSNQYPDPSHREISDEVVRTFYVGMTRARESLTICAPSDPTGRHAQIWA